MIKPVLKSHKIIGILAILFGLIAFTPFINFNESKLLFNDESTNFFVRYSLVISFIAGGIFFIIMGILQYIGVLIPYYLVRGNKYEKAKIHVIATALGSPVFILWSVLLFSESENTKFKIAWVIMLLYLVLELIRGVITIKNHSTNESV